MDAEDKKYQALQQANQNLAAQGEVNRELIDKLQKQVDELKQQSSDFQDTLLAVNRQACCAGSPCQGLYGLPAACQLAAHVHIHAC